VKRLFSTKATVCQIYLEGDRIKTYEMRCDCGKTVAVEAANRNEAIRKVKEIMTEETIREHMQTEHPDQPILTPEQAQAMIEQKLTQVT
jgi:hypothetical protein